MTHGPSNFISLAFSIPSHAAPPSLDPQIMFRTALRRYPAATRVIAFPKSPLPPTGAQPTPAERPSDVPDSISFEHKPVPAEVADKFEPIVNDMSKTVPEDVVAEEPKPSTATTMPLEPPAAEAIPDKPDLSSLPSLDIDPGMPAAIAEPTSSSGDQTGSKERTGARAKHSMSSIDRRWRTMRRLALAGSLVGGGIGAWYLANKDEPGMNDAGSAWERFKNNASELTDVRKGVFLVFLRCC